MCNSVEISDWTVFFQVEEKRRKSFRAKSPSIVKKWFRSIKRLPQHKLNTTLKSNMTKDRLAALHAVSLRNVILSCVKWKVFSTLRESIKNRALIAVFLANWRVEGKQNGRDAAEPWPHLECVAVSVYSGAFKPKFLIEWCRKDDECVVTHSHLLARFGYKVVELKLKSHCCW